MKKFKIGKVLVVTILVIVFWMLIGFNHFNGESNSLEVDNTPIVDYDKVIAKENYINDMDNFYTVIKKEDDRRRVEEHKKRMEILKQERIKLEELERQRLAKIEAEKKKEQELHNQQKQVNDGNKQITYSNSGGWRTFEATAYTPYCTGCSGTTAVGINVRNSIYYKGYRIIAVDPRIIPLWSLVEVITPFESYTALAGDTGGSIKNFRVDLLMKDKKSAYSFGRRNVQMRVIGSLK